MFWNILTVLNTLAIVGFVAVVLFVDYDADDKEFDDYITALESKKRVSRETKKKVSKPVKKASGRSIQPSNKAKRQR